MKGIDNLASELQKTITEKDSKKRLAYDADAVVKRVDGDTVWVQIAGGIDETPAERTLNAKVGDTVKVRVVNHSAFIMGNNTNPPTDDTVAYEATYLAQNAEVHAFTAEQSAIDAHKSAESARVDAAVAHDMALEAANSADEAKQEAGRAYTEAENAKSEAYRATGAANDALGQLSVVEDVVGTLNWISDHGTYTKTEDTELDPNKTYFVKINGVYTPVANPDPEQIKRYYELTLDDSIQNYISTHLALTDEGLYVVKDDLGYKILIANDGMKVYDADGHLVSTFGEYIRFSSEKPQYIGSDDAYIIFDPSTGQINIGGNVVLGGDMTLDKLLSEVNALEVEYTLSEDSSTAYFQAHIFRGHDDVTTEFDPRCFTWYYKTEDGEEPINGNNGANTGYTMTVDINNLFEYEGHVITHFTHSYVDYYIEDGHAYVKADSVAPQDIGEYGFTIDEYGDLIYSYDANTVADFEIQDGRLKALNQYGIFGNKLTRETAIYKKGALAAALASKAENQDFFQAEQLIYIQAVSGTLSISPYTTWVDWEGETVIGTPPNAESGQTPRWTLKRPTYQHNYPVIFTAKQVMTKKVDGTIEITCTKPLMDDTQTIIDGGHITTGTIDTARLNAEEIKTKIVKTTQLSIGQIDGLQGQIDGMQEQIDDIDSSSVSKYITDIDGKDGITIKAINSTTDTATTANYLKLNPTDGLNIYNKGVSVAKYGSVARIGKEAASHVSIDADSVDIIASNGDEVATFGNEVRLGAIDAGSSHASISHRGFRVKYVPDDYDGIPSDISTSAEIGISTTAMEEEIEYQDGSHSHTVWDECDFSMKYEADAGTEIKITAATGSAGYFTEYTFTAGVPSTDKALVYDGHRSFHNPEGGGTPQPGKPFIAHIQLSNENDFDEHKDEQLFIKNDNGEYVAVSNPVKENWSQYYYEMEMEWTGPDRYFHSILYILKNESGGYLAIGSRTENFAANKNTATFGDNLVADESNQVAIGEWNRTTRDGTGLNGFNDSASYAFMIGNGTRSGERSNAFAVTRSGQPEFTGFIFVPYINVNDLKEIYSMDANPTDDEYMNVVTVEICKRYPQMQSTIFIGQLSPDSAGWYWIYIYDTGDVTEGTTWKSPKYAFGKFTKWPFTETKFYFNDYSFYTA